MYKNMVKMIFVSILSLFMVPTAFALGGGGAGSTEPGGACEDAGEGMFSRAKGAPFQGTTTVTWNFDDATVGFRGEATQFGTGCMVSFIGGFLNSISQEDFEALTARDLVGICITNVQESEGNTGDCSKKDSEFMETLVSNRLRAVDSTPERPDDILFNVDVMLTPLSQDSDGF